jgi:hypothetical protein
MAHYKTILHFAYSASKYTAEFDQKVNVSSLHQLPELIPHPSLNGASRDIDVHNAEVDLLNTMFNILDTCTRTVTTPSTDSYRSKMGATISYVIVKNIAHLKRTGQLLLTNVHYARLLTKATD